MMDIFQRFRDPYWKKIWNINKDKKLSFRGF